MSVNGPVGKKRLANNINLTVERKESDTLLMQLDELGFKIATSSACSASNQEPSHVLKAIGLSDKNAQSSLRITLGRYSNLKNTMQLAESLLKIVDKN
jgi:cysteine desulfurase